jgi:type III secretion protein N (ATPase)
MTEPIADETRSILDGHIVLSRKLASSGHYPAIDILSSISRVMSSIVDKEHKNMAGEIRNILAKYAEMELLVQIGEYKKGTDAAADNALARIVKVNGFLKQKMDESCGFAQTLTAMRDVLR